MPADFEIVRSALKKVQVSRQQSQSRATLGMIQMNTELRSQVMEACIALGTLEEVIYFS